MERHYLALFVLMCFATVAPVAAAQTTVVISDSTFDPADWAYDQWATSPAYGAATSVSVGGDEHHQVTHVLGDPSIVPPTAFATGITTIHLKLDAPYDPSVAGAIVSLDYSELASTVSTEAGTWGGGTGIALMQDGIVYRSAVLSTTRDSVSGPLPSPWLPVTATAFTEIYFYEVVGPDPGDTDITSHPDFSVNGGPIQFGYFRINTDTFSDVNERVTAIDDWSVTLHVSGPIAEFIRGDANDDGGLDIADAVAVLESLFVPGGAIVLCLDAADINDEGVGDISDAIALLSSLFGGGPPLSGSCEPDSTADALDCGDYNSCP